MITNEESIAEFKILVLRKLIDRKQGNFSIMNNNQYKNGFKEYEQRNEEIDYLIKIILEKI